MPNLPHFYRLSGTSLVFSTALLLSGCFSNPVVKESLSTTEPVVVPDVEDKSSGLLEPQLTLDTKSLLLGYHEQWEGTPYKFGGNSREGIDCSAYVMNAYRSVFDVSLPRTTLAQAEVGEPIDKSELVPGDLVLFKTGRNSRHVGIFVGDNGFMHASSSKGVIISSLDNVYWRKKYWKSIRPSLPVSL